MLWIPHPGVARKRRLALGHTIEKTCELTDLSPGAVRRVEKGEPARVETIDALAKALGLTRDALAEPRLVGAEAPAPARKSAGQKPQKPAPTPAPPTSEVPLRVEDIARPSRLGALKRREEKVTKQREPIEPISGLPLLTVGAVQDLYSAFSLSDGVRYAVTGRITDHRGMSPVEAAELGTSIGIGTRFHFVRHIDEEATFGVTVHAPTAELTRALLRLHDTGDVVIEARVVIAKDKASIFYSFATVNPHPWTVVVERIVVDDKRPAQKRK